AGSLLGPNQPPAIEILDARAPQGSPTAGVRVRWAARDPDGRVVQCRWQLTPWVLRRGDAVETHATTAEECLLPAPEHSHLLAVTAPREPERFTLWAIDDAGARSEPATLALFTNNIAPSVSIISPTPSSLLRAQTTQSVCIVWQGIDPDGIHTQKP